MSDEILPKSRTEADKQSFTRDDNGKIARRVTDDVTHDKLDTVITSLSGMANTIALIYNISVALSNTEVSHALPANTKGFIIRSRNRSQLQIAYNSGQTNTTFLTLRSGAVYEDRNFYASQTIYFQSNQNGETVEIVAYT